MWWPLRRRRDHVAVYEDGFTVVTANRAFPGTRADDFCVAVAVSDSPEVMARREAQVEEAVADLRRRRPLRAWPRRRDRIPSHFLRRPPGAGT